jgi:hypothetical protein
MTVIPLMDGTMCMKGNFALATLVLMSEGNFRADLVRNLKREIPPTTRYITGRSYSIIPPLSFALGRPFAPASSPIITPDIICCGGCPLDLGSETFCRAECELISIHN